MAQAPVKTFSSIEDIYPTSSACSRERTRWRRVVDTFTKVHGRQPSHIIRAPGRVNVLGEHIDYSLFPVIPAAIEQDILIAISTEPSFSSTPVVQIANTSPKYAQQEFRLSPDSRENWVVEGGLGKDWCSYAKATIAECSSRSKDVPASMKWLVDGVVPEGAGLSSSAAFVVASVLAVSVANGRTADLNQSDVVKMALKSEHRLGLVNGGMDQAASVFCLPGQLLHLSFHPELSPDLLPLPSSLALVITNSLEPHALADSAPERYNLRVFENLCAVRLLLHSWKVEVDGSPPRSKEEAGRVWMKEALAYLQDSLGLSEEESFKRVAQDLDSVLGVNGRDKKGWTLEEIVAASGMSREEFDDTFTKFIEVRADRFHLYKRAKHTIEESLRVVEFKALCDKNAAAGASQCSQEVQKQLGELINASHASLRDLYAATVPSVDTLQKLCLESGALGSRQTGGGWGGAVISLVPVSSLDEFMSSIKGKFSAYEGLSDEAMGKAVFATAPGCGAGVLEMTDAFLQSL